jgi:non-ribosomal peptide synthase protein (TIGR01720 family)
VASERTVRVALNSEETQALLHDVPARLSSEINDVLLTALVVAFRNWTGAPSLAIDLEGHGREALFDDVDLSRTVGWFTTIFPVLLTAEATATPREVMRSVKERLDRLPNRGIGYGVLRYLTMESEVAARLRALPPAEVIFNYLGQFDRLVSASNLIVGGLEWAKGTQSRRQPRSHLLDINALVSNGRLELVWGYSENLHRRATIERLARDYVDTLRSLIAEPRAAAASGYAPSDFPDAELSREQLANVIAEIGLEY